MELFVKNAVGGRSFALHHQDEGDGVDGRVPVQHPKAAGQVVAGDQPRRADHVHGIGELPGNAENLPQLVAGGAAQRRQPEPGLAGEVTGQHRGPARDRQDEHAIAAGDFGVGKKVCGLDHGVDGFHPGDAALAENGIERGLGAGQAAGMGDGGGTPGIGASQLEHHHRLFGHRPGKGVAVGAAIADAFEDVDDDRGVGIIGKPGDVIGAGDHRFVTGRDQVVEAEAPVDPQFHGRVDQTARLRDHRHPALDQVLGQVGEGGGQTMAQADDAHAIGTVDGHAGVIGEVLEPRLARASRRGVVIGEAVGHHHRRRNAAGDGRLQRFEHVGVGHRQGDTVGRFRQGADIRPAAYAADGRVIGIDRPDRPLEAAGDHVAVNSPAHIAPVRRAHHRHRAGFEEGVEPRPDRPSGWPFVHWDALGRISPRRGRGRFRRGG